MSLVENRCQVSDVNLEELTEEGLQHMFCNDWMKDQILTLIKDRDEKQRRIEKALEVLKKRHQVIIEENWGMMRTTYVQTIINAESILEGKK